MIDLLKIEPYEVVHGVEGKNFLIYGAPGTRKTTVASQFPDALFLATEIGFSFIPGVSAVPITTWYEFTSVVRQLKNKEVRAKYKTIVIDTIDLLSSQCKQHILAKYGVEEFGQVGYGRAWTDYKNELSRTINLISQMGYGLVILAHDKELFDEVTEDGSKIQKLVGSKPIMDNQTASVVEPMVDFILWARREDLPEGQTLPNGDTTSVYLYNKLSEGFRVKSRLQNLENRIEFNFTNLDNAIKEAIQKIDGINVVETAAPVVHAEQTVEELVAKVKELYSSAVALGLGNQAETIYAEAIKISIDQVQEVHRPSLNAVIESLTQLTE